MIQTCRIDLIFGWLVKQDMKLGMKGRTENFEVPMGSELGGAENGQFKGPKTPKMGENGKNETTLQIRPVFW